MRHTTTYTSALAILLGLIASVGIALFCAPAEAVEECGTIEGQSGYEALVVPWNDTVEAVAVIHAGYPVYEYVAGPVPVRELGAGCYAVYYKHATAAQLRKSR